MQLNTAECILLYTLLNGPESADSFALRSLVTSLEQYCSHAYTPSSTSTPPTTSTHSTPALLPPAHAGPTRHLDIKLTCVTMLSFPFLLLACVTTLSPPFLTQVTWVGPVVGALLAALLQKVFVRTKDGLSPRQSLSCLCRPLYFSRAR